MVRYYYFSLKNLNMVSVYIYIYEFEYETSINSFKVARSMKICQECKHIQPNYHLPA